MVSSAKGIADQLEQRFVELACDGFIVAATHIPERVDEAGKRYQEIVDKHPEFAHVNLARYGLATSQYRNGEVDKAKEILATSDADWETIAPLTGAPDQATLHAYRDRYREGIPHRPIADEEADARVLYRVLAEIGGRDLVGPSPELEPGTF